MIGKGTFAQVWKAAHNERPGRIVAVKIATDDAFRRQLSREGRLPDINQSNVVPILDADTLFAEHPYVVMPFYPAGSLANLIAQNPRGLPEDRVTSMLHDILSGLGAAHQQGIVHRDIKPANILLDETGRALIADFGLSLSDAVPNACQSMIQSNSLSRDTNATIAGTLAYLAPEVLQGDTATKASDVYSVGVLLFEMLTGRRPQGLELPSQVRADLLRREYFDALFYYACRPVAERYPSATAMARAVEGRPNPFPWGFQRSELPAVATVPDMRTWTSRVKATRWISLALLIVLNLIKPRAGAIFLGTFLVIVLVAVISPENGKPDKTSTARTSVVTTQPEKSATTSRVTTPITLTPTNPSVKMTIPGQNAWELEVKGETNEEGDVVEERCVLVTVVVKNVFGQIVPKCGAENVMICSRPGRISLDKHPSNGHVELKIKLRANEEKEVTVLVSMWTQNPT